MIERKSLNEIHRLASEKLPDANILKDEECIVPVDDGQGKVVNVTFQRFDDDQNPGWIPKSSDYFED